MNLLGHGRGAHRFTFASLGVGVALCTLALLPPARPASAQVSAPQIFARVSPSIAVIETSEGHGTGFLIDPTHVMTAAHVVQDFDAVRVRFGDGISFLSARVVARDRIADMAIVEIQEQRAVTTVISAVPDVIGSDLYLIGFPGNTGNSARPVFSRGILSWETAWGDAGVSYVWADVRGEAGVSGGPILDANGDVVAVAQFRSPDGAYMIAASASDLKARAGRLLRGEDVDGVAAAPWSGPPVIDADVRLRAGTHPAESFSIMAGAATTLRIALDAPALTGTVTATLHGSDGTLADTMTLDRSKRSGAISTRLAAGQRSWLTLSSRGNAEIKLRSTAKISRLGHEAAPRSTGGLSSGMLMHGGDVNCQPIALRVGQNLTARVESVTFSPTLYIASPGGAVVAGGTATGEGIRGSEVQSSVTSASDGDFTVCVGAASPMSFAGGYLLSLNASAPVPPAPRSGSFRSGEPRLVSARQENATVALLDGRVLTVGGSGADGTLLATAEIYDPVTQTVTPMQSRDTVARRNATAVVLDDGRVLVLGGITSEGTSDAVSILDPSNASWTPAGRLNTPRLGGDAVLLADGRVVVLNGTDGLKPLASAEIFDPSASRFTTTGSATVARIGSTATKLHDGRILIAGGLDEDRNATASAEIFDPRVGRFSVTGELIAGRYSHASTLLPSGMVLITGGASDKDDSLTAELYDPQTGEFQKTGAMGFPRKEQSASLLPDGRVLVAGGVDASDPDRETPLEIGAVELYDPGSGQFTYAGALPFAGRQMGVGLPNGMVVFMGGSTEARVLDAIQSYVPS